MPNPRIFRFLATTALLVAAASGLAAQTLFTDSAYVFPGVEPCPDDYSQTDDCYNLLAPLTPSIERSLVTPSRGYEVLSYNSPWEVPLDEATQTFDFASGPKSEGHGLVLPFRRASSDDGRLALGGKKPATGHPYKNLTDNTLPSIMLFRPENVGSDLTVGAAPSFESAAVGHLHPVMYQDPRSSNVSNRYDMDGSKLNGPGTFHMSLCEDADKDPRFCSAQLTATGPGSTETVTGDCYDETVLVSLERGDALHKWELRSVPLTVFVPDGKKATNSEIYLYPRTAGTSLPPLSEIEALDQVGVGQSWSEVLEPCDGSSSNQPFYCQYVNSQSFLEDFQVHRKDDWQNYPDPYVTLPGGDGNSYYFTFLEAITTSDGHLLVLNGGSSIYYAYNEERCVASGFDRFEPLSKMPTDPEIYVNYDIGRSQRRNGQAIPFRDSLGQPITPGNRIDGAYPWMDRAGKNILFSHQNAARDHYYATDIHPKFTSTNSKPHDHPDHKNRYNPDREPGKQVAVIGAWTQGKTVIVDNVSHPTDFGGVYSYAISGINFIKSFEMELYQGGPSLVRPRAPRGMSSFENQFNHVEALSPVSPFDVAWIVSTDTQRNSELVFDDYLTEGALIVAHMNSPVHNVADIAGQSFRALPADGFVAEYPEKSVRGGHSADFGFKQSPLVQNAATTSLDFRDDADDVPSHLVLRGGARVEPVALGGVIGKGIYLDGLNDYLEADVSSVDTGDWFVGAWFDSRELNANTLRTAFHFPDGSWIGLSRNKLRVFHSDHPQPTREMGIAGLELQPGEFFHLALKARTVAGKVGWARRIEIFVNGTRVERKPVTNLTTGAVKTANHFQYESVQEPGFDMAGSYPFAVGDPGPSAMAAAAIRPSIASPSRVGSTSCGSTDSPVLRTKRTATSTSSCATSRSVPWYGCRTTTSARGSIRWS